MTNVINQDILKTLEKFYKKLYVNVIRSEKKLESDSVLLTLIKITSNKTSKLLNESSIKSIAFSQNHLDALKQIDYIRISDDNNKLDEYILTAQGIWKIEKTLKEFEEGKILEFLQNKYFTFSVTNKPLRLIEKIILLAMISVRTFSSDSSMNLTRRSVSDYWLEIFNETYKFLKNRIETQKGALTFEKQGNEHPVAYAMRRANDLPRKTQHIFCYLGNKQYYLNINDSSKLSEPKLQFLFKLIFSKIENLAQVDEIQKFCELIAYEKSKFVKEDFKFIDYEFDVIIKNSLTQLYLD